MKRTILLFATLIFSSYSFAQTIRRVNNIPGAASGANTYSTIPAAITAAATGDIIYIEPSTIAYSEAVSVDKKLSFIGNGNFLEQNPNTPFDKKASRISGGFTFASGSANSSVTGIHFENNVILQSSNILIKKCRLNASLSYYDNSNDIVVTQSFLWEIVRSQFTGGQNWSVTNNILRAPIYNLQGSHISNNTFVYSGTQISDNVSCTISNNIFYRRTSSSVSSSSLVAANSGSNIINNLLVLASGSTLPASPDAGNNVYSADPDNIFAVTDPSASSPQKDAEYQLKSGSPATGIGTGGTNAGAFGGITPYALSTLPNIPIITSAVSSGVGNSSTPLSVTISVRSN